ncbi:MAG: hypothetical protein ACPIOQ_47975 [Promethearchaeia archaeon]
MGCAFRLLVSRQLCFPRGRPTWQGHDGGWQQSPRQRGVRRAMRVSDNETGESVAANGGMGVRQGGRGWVRWCASGCWS